MSGIVPSETVLAIDPIPQQTGPAERRAVVVVHHRSCGNYGASPDEESPSRVLADRYAIGSDRIGSEPNRTDQMRSIRSELSRQGADLSRCTRSISGSLLSLRPCVRLAIAIPSTHFVLSCRVEHRREPLRTNGFKLLSLAPPRVSCYRYFALAPEAGRSVPTAPSQAAPLSISVRLRRRQSDSASSFMRLPFW